MADLNVVYAPVVEYEDPDVIIGYRPHPIQLPFAPEIPVHLPDEVQAAIKKQNSDSVETGNAVKVPYKGTTPQERATWVADRLQAINNRVQFIKERSNQLLTRMQETGSAGYDAAMKIFTTALSAVPVVGSAISYIVGKQDAARAIDDYKLQALVKDYAADLNFLGQTRNELLKEYTAQPNASGTGNGTDPKAGAPTPIPIWYYYVGALVVLLFLIILKNRRNSR